MQAYSPEELVYDILKLPMEWQFVSCVRLVYMMGCSTDQAKELDKFKTFVRFRISCLICNRHLAARVEDLCLHRADLEDCAEDIIDSLALWNKLATRGSCILFERILHCFFISLKQAINIFTKDLLFA